MRIALFALTVVTAIVGTTMAQRPMYAGSSSIGRPGLASRFKDQAQLEAEEQDLNNRFGEGMNAGNQPVLPVDALGDRELVNRLNEWPREHRPFWLINAEAIEANRHPTWQQQQRDFQARGSFPGDNNPLPVRPGNHRSSFLSPMN